MCDVIDVLIQLTDDDGGVYGAEDSVFALP